MAIDDPPQNLPLIKSFRWYMWATLLLYVAVVAIVITGFLVNRQHQYDIAGGVLSTCQENRELISRIILRSLDATFEDWEFNKERVLFIYREQMRTLGRDADVVDRAVTNATEILELSNPSSCEDVRP